VLHSPNYREKYREFLKVDFPRVPYPKDRASFEALVRLGGKLRWLHLLESPKVEEYITTFPVAGSGKVEKVSYVDGRVYINALQYFWDVPEVAWNHYIGGYQPAQKWLKDRKGRTLTWEDISHYQSMIVALTETSRVMGEVDGVIQI
jgi:predicted helicase